jgi:uncharacterized membrane protein
MRHFDLNDLEAVHLIAACMALVLGPLVLALPKGTRGHIRLGYLYTACMLVVNVPVFFTYEAFGRFGIFHVFAVVSLVTLTYGVGSAVAQWPRKGWLRLHTSGMYWSVMGLYFAGAAQIMVSYRLRPVTVIILAVAMAVIATVIYARYKQRWLTPGRYRQAGA